MNVDNLIRNGTHVKTGEQEAHTTSQFAAPTQSPTPPTLIRMGGIISCIFILHSPHCPSSSPVLAPLQVWTTGRPLGSGREPLDVLVERRRLLVGVGVLGSADAAEAAEAVLAEGAVGAVEALLWAHRASEYLFVRLSTY